MMNHNTQVTISATRSGKFEIDFFHTIYMDFLGSVKGHFGTVNTVSFGPKGKW